MLYFEREVSICLFQNCKKKLFPQTTELLELAERRSVITDNTLWFECYNVDTQQDMMLYMMHKTH